MSNKRQSKVFNADVIPLDSAKSWHQLIGDLRRGFREFTLQHLIQVLNGFPAGHGSINEQHRESLTDFVSAAIETSGRLMRSMPYKPEDSVKSLLERTRTSGVTTVQKFVEGISFAPFIAVSPDGRSLQVDYKPKTLSQRKPGQLKGLKKDLELGAYHMAISTVLSLIDSGAIDRIRRCEAPDCGLWFFAGERSDKKRCGPTCRQRIRSRKPDFMKKRKEYLEARNESKFIVQERKKRTRQA